MNISVKSSFNNSTFLGLKSLPNAYLKHEEPFSSFQSRLNSAQNFEYLKSYLNASKSYKDCLDLIRKPFKDSSIYNEEETIRDNVQQYETIIEQKMNILNLLNEYLKKEKEQNSDNEVNINEVNAKKEEIEKENEEIENDIKDLINDCECLLNKIKSRISVKESVVFDKVKINSVQESYIVPVNIGKNNNEIDHENLKIFEDFFHNIESIKNQLSILLKDFNDEIKYRNLKDKKKDQLEKLKKEYSLLKQSHQNAMKNEIIK